MSVIRRAGGRSGKSHGHPGCGLSAASSPASGQAIFFCQGHQATQNNRVKPDDPVSTGAIVEYVVKGN
jgi:hypothetical protein